VTGVQTCALPISDTNDAAIVEATGPGVPMQSWTKRELAAALWDRVEALLERRANRS